MFVGPRRRQGAVDELVVLVPTRRGVHASVTLDIASAAPFALQWWTRRVQLPLPSSLHVAPRCGGAQPAPRRPDEGTGDGVEPSRVEAGLPRGARPYVPGDARRLVHWRSTAHAGRLMVREVEQPAAEPVTITVELPADPDAAERVAEEALGSVVRLLQGGDPVLLVTREESGPVSGPVADRRSAAGGWPGPWPGPSPRAVPDVSIVDVVRRANQPGVPEDSVRLRLACLATVLVSIAACASLGEIAWTTALGAMVLIAAGTAFSHATRARPPWWVKVLVALGAIAACVWFFHTVSSPTDGFTSVLDPLTNLLVAVLVVHSFHVPTRRDLLFTLAASGGLMAVGGALAIDLNFGLYVAAWAASALWALTEMWTSASGGGRISASGLVLALAATSMAAAAVFLVLPAPVVSSRVNFVSHAGSGGNIGSPGGLAGDSGTAAQLSRAGSPAGPTRIGGYLGFAGSLNTALRGGLGNTLVMQVRAQRPSYWVGETFDTWDGQSWTESKPAAAQAVARGLTVRSADPDGRRAVRAERPPDLLRRDVDGEPRVPRGERR